MRYVFYAMAAVAGLYVWIHNTADGRAVLRKLDTPAAGSPRAARPD
ncbi:hypothetical protein [Novosphingobium sp. B 225]|nr:hypothetical protein [Novosphingobium sp. B 225]